MSLAALTLGGVVRATFAADAAFAAPQIAVTTGTGGSLLRTTLALLVVLAAVLGTAWFARRLRGLSGGDAGKLAVLAQLSLGARERAVLIRAGGERLLLGVAPGNVRMLHVLTDDAGASASEPPDARAPAAATPSFKSLLLRSLGK